MKNALIAIIFALTLSCTSMATAQPAPRNKVNTAVNEFAQNNDAIASNDSQESISKWKQPTSTTVTVTSPPGNQTSIQKAVG